MFRKISRKLLWAALIFSSSIACAGCKRDAGDASKDAPAAAPPASASAPEVKQPSAQEAREVAMKLPAEEQVQPIVNPKKLPPYSGPVGGVRGTITISGDSAPDLPEVLAKMDAHCTDSRQTFGKVFREGPGRTLADVLVAVTGYDGYVPIVQTDFVVRAEGCAFHTRTVAITYGQRLVIEGLDNRPYVPEVLGQPLPAQLFVLPTMPRVSIAPRSPGRFKLVDSMRLFNVSELFVLPYRTVAVTGLNGQFEIQGIPAGQVRIDALLPQTQGVSGRQIEILAGKTVEINLEISFSSEAWEKRDKPDQLETMPAQ